MQRIEFGELRRLMILCPPRHGKSEHTTIRYPVYRLERDRKFQVAVGCYNQEFASRFGRKARGIARKRFPLSDERKAVAEWETPEGGVYRACGVGSPPTGAGFDLLVIDDPIRSREEAESLAYRDRVYDWYTDDLYTRLEPGAAVILIYTPWHVDDLGGRILNSAKADEWEVLRFPAIAEANDPLGRPEGAALWPERYDVAALRDIEKVMGAQSFAGLYGMRPKRGDGNMFKAGWFPAYRPSRPWDAFTFLDGKSVARNDCIIVAILDPATGKGPYGDNSAIGIFAFAPGGIILVLDMIAERIPLESLARELQRMADRWNAEYVAVEANGFQVSVCNEFRKISRRPVHERSHEGKSKLVRAIPAMTKAEAGLIRIPGLADAVWTEKFLDEITSFTGRGDEKDDQVDVLSMAVAEESRFAAEAGEVPAAGGGKTRYWP